ncbi:hypothetical protein [Parafannyhessea umbonata]|uniref:Uncharacterized protein n=2 Tax=Parafannyhessea umbonata TaxID=604330 RepID=A0A1H1NW87_9ACTN|nr:hypothetical protein [Parafannyhessea umbonata]MCI7219612.1 hypothetical protein [Parafannyhessea umbonata]MDD6565660.1 hypothetical protein [Parafannyhessea umbonata]SDS03238.1 hypothetical protein SAMN04489857_2006 [Parafannyhessea umbonata]
MTSAVTDLVRELQVMSGKEKVLAIVLFLLGGFYPLAGFVAFGIGKWKKAARPVYVLPCAGAILSLALFVIQFCTAVA